jgi:hypothetical protein
MKDGFVNKDGKEPPKAPKRPDSIEGFEFQQGKCMVSGKQYMMGRWTVPGNFFADGIDYLDCAKRCMEKDDCAAFDVWNGNNDCQLFYDETHFGDGTEEEECFLKVGFVDRDPPPKPKRPEHIEGFRFEQGQCMAYDGGHYGSNSKYEGSYYEDGIDYEECAKRCAENPKCAAFDVWNRNNDCQLFLDQNYFGNTMKSEECFIKEDFQGSGRPTAE